MLFNSLQFAIFFPLVTLGYFLLPHKHRWWWLLIASSYFYMALVPIYILILFFLISVDYGTGLIIEKSLRKNRKIWLFASLFTNILILFIFKYFNFFNENIASMIHYFGWNYPIKNLSFLLPIGLSFHTFQSMSYTIEVYYGRQKAEKNLGIYALYVMFYPQLVAGPIERPQNLLHQFREHHVFSLENAKKGLRLMLVGFFKKLAIADQLALIVAPCFNTSSRVSSLELLIGVYCFSIQIFCDFSGYSDIALGTAKIMGFDLMKNFNEPYEAQSISEFWHRWHISLSTWFRDYLYIPLGGNKNGFFQSIRNLWIVFLVSGFWHGAQWTFVIWGALHAFYMTISILTKPLRTSIFSTMKLDQLPKMLRFGKTIYTFHLVALSWIFFRASSVDQAFKIIKRIFIDLPKELLKGIPQSSNIEHLSLAIMLMIVTLLFPKMERIIFEKQSTKHSPFLRWSCLYIVFLIVTYLVAFLTLEEATEFKSQQFIYFQF